jgi:hypothetical protein
LEDETGSAHKSGYFQFSNRSDNMCAVKIVAEGSNIYNEISRPPYLSGEHLAVVFHVLFSFLLGFISLSLVFASVLPRSSVYADIEGLSSVYVIILYDNPNKLVEGEEVVYTSMKAKSVSPPCKVNFFGKYTIYKIRCLHKNVLVKYKDGGALEPRSGTSRRLKYKAAGFFSGAFSSSKSTTSEGMNADSELDFTTNIEHISEILV